MNNLNSRFSSNKLLLNPSRHFHVDSIIVLPISFYIQQGYILHFLTYMPGLMWWVNMVGNIQAEMPIANWIGGLVQVNIEMY